MYRVLPLLVCGFTLVVFITIIVSSFTKQKLKINLEVSDKYKKLAYDLIENNEKINIERRKYKIRKLLSLLTLIGILSSFFLFPVLGGLIVFIFIISVILMIFIIVTNKDSSVVFGDIIPSIIESYMEGLTYNHFEGISSSIYREARFEGYDRYNSDDLISGNINDQEFIMSEVHTERRHTDKDGNTSYTTIFHGAFAKVFLKKDFKCFLNIVNNRIKLFSRDKYITIDNEEFEKIYDVFTDDKIKAMRLLTPDVTTKMIDLYNETGIYCEIKVINNILYIRLFTGELFSFVFSNPEKESELLGKSIAVIDSVMKVLENFIGEIERFDV